MAEARADAVAVDWSGFEAVVFLSARVIDNWDLADLAHYIDWTPFLQTWEMKGVYPRTLGDGAQDEAARALFADAQAMLARITAEGWFKPRAVVGFWPANAVGDDIRLWTGEDRHAELATFFTLRQQMTKRDGRPNVALSDFVAPQGRDYVGGFVVTAGPEAAAIAERFKAAHDDYSAIMVQALADRSAEAMTEALHARVRRDYRGCAATETFTPQQLIGEPYAGIRPAPGYPAQSDHTEKATLLESLNATAATGVELTESMAMWTGSSVSGLYLGHPEAYYFGVAKVEEDQVRDYATRKGMAVAEVERWLRPMLTYIPRTAAT